MVKLQDLDYQDLLIRDPDDVVHIITYEIKDHCVNFEVYSVDSYDRNGNPDEGELFYGGWITFSGCSHIKFNDETMIHLCGKIHWNELSLSLKKCWDFIAPKIPNFRLEEDHKNIKWAEYKEDFLNA